MNEINNLTSDEDAARASNTSLSSESAYSSNGNAVPLPSTLNRKDSVRSYKLRRKLKRHKQIQRLVSKDGMCKVVHCHVKYRGVRFISDMFTTMVDLRWRYLLSVFTVAYVLGWFVFGIVWWLIAVAHGDSHLSERNVTADFEPCVENVETFTGAFLFSVETQTTIGYGFRSVTEACPVAVIVVVSQSVFSCLIDAVMIGCIFAKIARPKKRAATLKFSRNAVIAQRDGQLCFMFRVGDIRMSHLYEAHMRAYLIKPRVTAEGEIIPIVQYNMDLGYDTGEDRIFLVWPLIISHVIDENSPLYEYSAQELQSADFEIIIILEGVVEQTGLTTQARTSYLPNEIVWGSRFCSSVVALKHESDKQYSIDYAKFDDVYPVPDMTRLSAKSIDQRRQLVEEEDNNKMFLDCMHHYMNNVINKQHSQNGVNGSSTRIVTDIPFRDVPLRDASLRRRLRGLSSKDGNNLRLCRNSDPLAGKRLRPSAAVQQVSVTDSEKTVEDEQPAISNNESENEGGEEDVTETQALLARQDSRIARESNV